MKDLASWLAILGLWGISCWVCYEYGYKKGKSILEEGYTQGLVFEGFSIQEGEESE